MEEPGFVSGLHNVMMKKDNWEQTLERFDLWWSGTGGTVLLAADLKRPAPVFRDMNEFTDIPAAHQKYSDYLKSGTFAGDLVPDMSSYLGPGSLCTFIGAEPIYSDKTIWYRESGASVDELIHTCRKVLEGQKNKWYRWSLEASRYYSVNAGAGYRTSMPDLQQNLDILAAVMGADRLFYEMMDNPAKVRELLEILYEVWYMAFSEHSDIITGEDGYSSFTHYNIIGKGKTSVLQSDISCMMSPAMFDEFEMPYLRKQCNELDNVIYHLDGPGAQMHLDSLLEIEGINAVQWVPGAGNPGNADACWDGLYDKIIRSGKGLYVFLQPDEIDGFLEKYGKGRLLIRSLANTAGEQIKLTEKYI